MIKTNIVLSEADIEALINGETIERREPGTTNVVTIRQSYLKDAVAPAINRKNKVVDTSTNAVLNKNYVHLLESDGFSTLYPGAGD